MSKILGRRIYDPDAGEWVNENYQHIAEVINDWDPRLRLMWIPEQQRTPEDKYPYAIGFFESELAAPYIVMHVAEDELDERLIAKLFDMRDAAKDPHTRLKNLEDAKAILEAKQRVEEQAELHDMARTLWKSPLHSFRHNGRTLNL